MIVADTCVVFHLFNETELTEKAQLCLSQDSEWILPSLWKEEYANVLSKLARQQHMNTKDVVEHFLYSVNELIGNEKYVAVDDALRVSIQYKISVYDAHFLCLALNHNIPLITEDKEVLRKCPSIASNMHKFLSRHHTK